MDVYHDNNIWGKDTPETKLTAEEWIDAYL